MNNQPKQKDFFLKELPPEAQTAVTRQLASVSDAVTQGAMNWGFEVVKHLTILNGAGLSAIVAIAQINTTTPATRMLAFHGAHVFAGGLVAALLSMLTIYATGLYFVRKFTSNVLQVSISTQPMSVLRLSREAKTLIGVNWTLAAISIILFFRGALCIASIT